MKEFTDNQLEHGTTLCCIEGACKSIKRELIEHDTKMSEVDIERLEEAYNLLLKVSDSYVLGIKDPT